MPDEDSPARLMLEGQAGHVAGLALLLAALHSVSDIAGIKDGEFLGLLSACWATAIVLNVVFHQVYVWACWRSELHAHTLSRLFGNSAFLYFTIPFTVFMVLRVLLAFALGWANRGTLSIDPVVGYGVAVVMLFPVVWLAYSIKRYFTFRRAFGIDARYRGAELEQRGIFRFIPNAMYTVGFLGVWIPAFLFQSTAALVLAAFCHAYIWVHYFCTEKPDMKRIYG